MHVTAALRGAALALLLVASRAQYGFDLGAVQQVVAQQTTVTTVVSYTFRRARAAVVLQQAQRRSRSVVAQKVKTSRDKRMTGRKMAEPRQSVHDARVRKLRAHK